MIKISYYKLVVILGIILTVISISYLFLSNLNKITGAFVIKPNINRIEASQKQTCGDGYCDNTENYETCKIDCPYPENH